MGVQVTPFLPGYDVFGWDKYGLNQYTSADYDMINVKSSNVAAVGYNVDNSTLQVEFKNGATYQYFDVPEIVFERLRDADSVGRYLATNIKGVYKYSQVGFYLRW